MKSFSESLQITKNMNLAKQCFVLMAERGIDPEKFVEWYCDFGVVCQEQGILLEGSMKWLETQSLLTEMPAWVNNTGRYVGNAFSNVFGAAKDKVAGAATGAMNMAGNAMNAAGNAIQNNLGPQAMGNYAQKAGNMVAGAQNMANQAGQTMSNMQDKFHQGMGHANWWRQAQSAEQALNLLHRRIGVSPSLMQAVGGQQFMQTILQLIQTLQSKDQTQIAAPAAPAAPMPAEDSTAEPWASHVESLQMKNQIRAGLRKLQSYGHDPVEFVEWFISEVQKMNEGLWDSAGEWLGNTWANTMGSANRWLTGAPKQKWGYDAGVRTKKKDSEAITKAVQSLDAFQKAVGNLNPEFKKTLDGVLSVLQGDAVKQHMSGEQPEQPQQPQPQQPPAMDMSKLSGAASAQTNPASPTPAPTAAPGSDPEVGGGPGPAPAAPSPTAAPWVDPKSVADARGNVAHKKRVGEELSDFEKEVDQVEGQATSDEEKHKAVAALLQKYGHAQGMNTPTECRKYWLDYFAESNFYRSILGGSGKSWFN